MQSCFEEYNLVNLPQNQSETHMQPKYTIFNPNDTERNINSPVPQ